MKELLGTALTESNQKKVLAMYVNRYTTDNIPLWSREEWKNGRQYPLQFRNDQEWLANTYFEVRNDNQLRTGRNNTCRSYPTYPNNPELRTK